MSAGNVAVIALAVAIGTLRVVGLTHPAFQAFAHLFVGVLFGMAYAQFMAIETEVQAVWRGKEAWLNFSVAALLSLLELGVFVVSRMLGVQGSG